MKFVIALNHVCSEVAAQVAMKVQKNLCVSYFVEKMDMFAERALRVTSRLDASVPEFFRCSFALFILINLPTKRKSAAHDGPICLQEGPGISTIPRGGLTIFSAHESKNRDLSYSLFENSSHIAFSQNQKVNSRVRRCVLNVIPRLMSCMRFHFRNFSKWSITG